MARKSNPDSVYRLSVHRNGGHLYAATHPFLLDENGRRKYRVLHWGTLTEDLRFIPGKAWLQAPYSEREKLVFPPEWDLSAMEDLNAGPALFGRTFERLGIREDLVAALGGDAGRADAFLSLVFSFYSTWSASGPFACQNPSVEDVRPEELDRFLELRRSRYAADRLCAVDSVVKYSSMDLLADRKYGKRAERIHYVSAVETVTYSLDARVPVSYRTFPGTLGDARGLSVLRGELTRNGQGEAILVTDRAYDSFPSVVPYLREGPMVLCVDVKQGFVRERIRRLGDYKLKPAGMRYDARSKRYCRQYPLEGERDLRLNLFFNPQRREVELAQIEAEIASQRQALQEMADYRVKMDRKAAKREYYLFDLHFDEADGTLASFAQSESKIERIRLVSGFFANVTCELDIPPEEAVAIYGLKYDQEKTGRRMRGALEFPAATLHPEDRRRGTELLLFLCLVLDACMRLSPVRR